MYASKLVAACKYGLSKSAAATVDGAGFCRDCNDATLIFGSLLIDFSKGGDDVVVVVIVDGCC